MFSLYTFLKIIGIIILAIFTLVIAMPVTDKVGSTDYPRYEHSIDRSRACPEGHRKDLRGNCKKGHEGPNNGNDDDFDFEDETESSVQIQVSTTQESHQENTSSASITTIDVFDDVEGTTKPNNKDTTSVQGPENEPLQQESAT